MEWLLLLLVGGLAAGVGMWAARSDSQGSDTRTGTGPTSSPGLPQGGGDRGRAVQLGPEELKQDIRQFLDQAPPQIQARSPSQKSDPSRRSKVPLKVTHNTDQLVARSSKFAHHRRALQNAELLVQKQKGEEALELFDRVANRIQDPEIQARIQTNIDDIKRWQAGFDTEEEKFNFPEIIVPLTLQTLALDNLTEGIRQLSNSLVQQLAAGGQAGGAAPGISPQMLQQLQSGAAPAQMQGGLQGQMQSGQAIAQSAAAQIGSGMQAGTGAPIIQQIIQPIAVPTGQQISPSGGITPGVAVPVGVGGPAGQAPGGTAAGAAIAFAGGPAGQAIPGTGAGGAAGAILPVIPQFQPPDGEWTGEGTTSPGDLTRDIAPPGVSDTGEIKTDGWTDADFDREWEKYKNLPAFDRRSGLDRRKSGDRRGMLDPKRKDRRSGTDRRKIDLFKEREEFLKKLEEHKKKKKDLQKLPPVKAPVKTEKEKAPAGGKDPRATIEIENATVHIGDYPPGGGGEPSKEDAKKMLFEMPPLDLPEVGMPGVKEFYQGSTAAGVSEAARDLSAQPLLNVGLPEGEAFKNEALPAPEAPEPLGGEPEAGAAPATATAGMGEEDMPEIPSLDDEPKEEKPQIQEIRGVLELKPPDEDDAPFLTLTYDFTKIPDSFKLSRDYHTMEYAYYKYKPMLVKAQEFTRRKMLKNALNYYRVIKSQNIPPEFKRMINRNIQDITEYLEKFLMSRTG
ncbi:MAG: hypothetical protein K8S54_20920 [Spirochaetia bacterium]|nr:hypothetical protein [Spirochaetia bacterium]